jgi:LPXTG-motif cell wall-anchored protein
MNRATAALSVAALAVGLTGVSATVGPVPQAGAAEATASAQGSFTGSLESPEAMEFSTAPAEIASVDELTWDSEKVGPTEQPYQAFELEHPGEFAPVSWTGMVDPSREVALLAWNYSADEWQQLRRETGAAPGQTVLEAYLSEDFANEAGQTHVAVIGLDDYMTGDQQWAPDEFGVTTSFADPADYDFSIAHVTDTQFLSEGAVNTSLNEAAQERFAEAYRAQMNWIVENADERKISYVAHTGDIIENWMLPQHPEDRAREEFEFASEMQSIIDEAGIPNGIIPGNHDNGWGMFGNDMFNDYFPAERYEAASTSWENASYGGPWREGDNSAHYDLFEIDGHDFVAVYLPYGHNTAQRNWANEVLQAFPDRDALLFTHAYLRASSNADASKAGGNIGYGDNGHLLRTQVVERNDNLVMVASGHYHGTTWNHNYNGDGGPVFEMLGDYQNYEVDGERNTGFMRLLQFDIDAGEVKVNTYSPRLDAMGATNYDPAGRYIAASDEYTAPLSLSSRGTTLMTDQVRIGDEDEALPELPDEEPTPEPTEPPSEPAPEEPTQELAIEQQADVTVVAGQEIEPLTIQVSDDEADVEFEGLPEGLVAVPDSREISGVPETPGVYEITVTAFDQYERETSMFFTVTVEEPADDVEEPGDEVEPGEVSIEQLEDVSLTVGQVIDPITIVVNDDEADLEFTGLPAGLEGDPVSREITGTPTETGEFDITVVSTTESGEEATMTFTITVAAETTATPTPTVDPAGATTGDDEPGDGSDGRKDQTETTESSWDLANTGATTTGLVLAALAMLGTGVGALALKRRRSN